MDKPYTRALLVMADDAWIEDIAVLDPTPNINLRLLEPLLAHGFHGDDDVSALRGGARPQDGSRAAGGLGEGRFPVLIHWERAEIDPIVNVSGGSTSGIFPGNKDEILTKDSVPNAQPNLEPFSEHEGAFGRDQRPLSMFRYGRGGPPQLASGNRQNDGIGGYHYRSEGADMIMLAVNETAERREQSVKGGTVFVGGLCAFVVWAVWYTIRNR